MTDDDDVPGAPKVIHLAGARRTSALGLAMLGVEEAIYGTREEQVVVVDADAGAPPDPNVKVTLGDSPQEATVIIRKKREST